MHCKDRLHYDVIRTKPDRVCSRPAGRLALMSRRNGSKEAGNKQKSPRVRNVIEMNMFKTTLFTETEEGVPGALLNLIKLTPKLFTATSPQLN